MAKKDTNDKDQTQDQVTGEQTDKIAEVKPKADRTSRLKVETSLPSVENNWQGSFNLTAVGLEDKPLVYTYGVGGELSKFFLQIIETGLKARFSVVIGGLKTPEEVYTALEKEITNLNAGIFSTRTARESSSSSFVDVVVAMAIVHVTKVKKEFLNVYPTVIQDVELLNTKQAEWAELDKQGKSKLMSMPLISAARATVAYCRNMEQVSEEADKE